MNTSLSMTASGYLITSLIPRQKQDVRGRGSKKKRKERETGGGGAAEGTILEIKRHNPLHA